MEAEWNSAQAKSRSLTSWHEPAFKLNDTCSLRAPSSFNVHQAVDQVGAIITKSLIQKDLNPGLLAKTLILL